MADRIWFAPVDTPIEDAAEWQEVGTVTDFQFTPDEHGEADVPWSWPTSQTFTMELEPGAARAMWEMIEKARRDQLHLIAASREVAASVLQLHPLGGGPWSMRRTTPEDFAELARILDIHLTPWQCEVLAATAREASRGGP